MKYYKLITLLCVLGVFFASCKEEPKNEWKDHYGFSNEDIIGAYSYSNISNAFDDVEGTGRHICPDAQVTIRASHDNPDWIEFSMNCPNETFSRTFEGMATPNEGDHMIHMSTGYIHSGGKIRAYNVTAYVLKNEKQELRLHGYAAHNTYVSETSEDGVTTYTQTNGEYYYFDVIKN